MLPESTRSHYGLLYRFRHRHRLLLLVLVVFLLSLPAVDHGLISQGAVSLMFTLIVVPSVLATGRNARRIAYGIALAVPCVGVALYWWLIGEDDNPWLHGTHLLSMSAFVAYTVGSMVGHLFRTSRVDEEILASAVGVYILVAILFASVYQALGLSGDTVVEGIRDPGRLSDYVYFSFSNQTTVGFGDLVPATPLVKSLSILQVVAAQMYLVVLMARLVGLHLVHRRGDPR